MELWSLVCRCGALPMPEDIYCDLPTCCDGEVWAVSETIAASR